MNYWKCFKRRGFQRCRCLKSQKDSQEKRSAMHWPLSNCSRFFSYWLLQRFLRPGSLMPSWKCECCRDESVPIVSPTSCGGRRRSTFLIRQGRGRGRWQGGEEGDVLNLQHYTFYQILLYHQKNLYLLEKPTRCVVVPLSTMCRVVLCRA